MEDVTGGDHLGRRDLEDGHVRRAPAADHERGRYVTGPVQ
jgi:hypothetical protein